MWSVRRAVLLIGAILLCACSRGPASNEPRVNAIDKLGIDGCNCAGASPAMTAPDGVAYPFQSVVSYYYKVLQADWTVVDDQDVLTTWLAPEIASTSEAFIAWQAKTIQVLRERGGLGFTHRYYDGIFGFLPSQAVPEACVPALDTNSRLTGMLGHVALSQAGVCGHNTDGTTKFWQVNNISLLQIGTVYDTNDLIAAGLAHAVEQARASHCILAQPAGPRDAGTGDLASEQADPVVPCRVALGDDAVTEAVVLPVPSSAVVAGVPLEHRAFTAAGTVEMPNGLDGARTILRSAQLRAMFAIGVPRFIAEPAAGPTQVRLVGHSIGPSRSPSSVLLADERSWVDGQVGLYESSCCHVECEREPGSLAAGSGSGSDGGVIDAGVGGGSDGGSDGGSGSPCSTVCVDEGACTTSSASAGIVVMVASVTNKDCAGDCPQPSASPPAQPPQTCAP